MDTERQQLADAAWTTIVRHAPPFPDGARLAGLAGGERGEALALDDGLAPWTALGRAFEQAQTRTVRRGRGAFSTPEWLARELLAFALDGAPTGPIIDPACGPGTFLIAAADHLVARGCSPTEAIGALSGAEVDELTLAVAEASLWWWALAHDAELDPGRPLLHAGDALSAAPAAWSAAAAAVVGNPPFLGQLARATRRPGPTDATRRARFAGVVDPYTDEAALFAVAALDWVRPGGRIALIQPRSVLAARDATRAREAISSRASLRALWLDDAAVFDAHVRVCAPVFVAGEPSAEVTVATGAEFWSVTVPAPQPGAWASLLSGDAPAVELAPARTLADAATVTAGFRDEYYGLTGAVAEAVAGDGRPRLVTSGAIDLADLRWGRSPVRFAKQRWQAPVVDVGAIESAAVERWVDARLRPKVLVATQTRVVEALVDTTGDLVPSVPVISVEPGADDDLWRLAAAVASPAATAWSLRRTAGTALSPDTIKLSAAHLRELPLPTDRDAWQRGAEAFERAQSAAGESERQRALRDYAAVMGAAYGVDAGVARWWAARRELR